MTRSMKNVYHEWKTLEAFEFHEIACGETKRGALEKFVTINVSEIEEYFVAHYQVCFET